MATIDLSSPGCPMHTSQNMSVLNAEKNHKAEWECHGAA